MTLKYVVTDLGTLGGLESDALGINIAGQATGWSRLSDGTQRAYRTAPNRPIQPADQLGTLGGATSIGYAINSSGQVTGDADTALIGPFNSVVRRAFRADPGQPLMVDLGTLAPAGGVNGFNNSGGRAINDAAVVVGFATVPPDGCGSSSHAFRTAPGGPVVPGASDLGTLVPAPFANCRSSTGWGVNNVNTAVGTAATVVSTGFPNHAFRFDNNAMVGVVALAGRDSTAFAINDIGEIVGQSNIDSDLFNNHAFLNAGPGTRDLGTLGGSYSAAYAINTRYPQLSQVVGQASTTNNAAFHAFLWTGNLLDGGSMIDLNTMIASGQGWELLTARGINNKGQIVGAGRLNAVQLTRAFRLDPSDVAASNLIALLSDPALALTAGQIGALTDKLQNTTASIQAGLNKQAKNQLNAFNSSVQTYWKTGKISSATAATLTAAANAIIAVL
ncbi:MAG TPA: hypothetical protein VNU71_03995 [Burkholderiaceae bacterium]|nr:hypothetical protein [Burkholderiaceae bacterium]